MRDYGSVSPKFWIGETGKLLRGDQSAQLLALYLMTSPHATMIGVFHCPIMYMAYETGLPLEGASKALQRLCEVGFCTYDAASETVFVIRMAAHQLGERLKADDKRAIGAKKAYGNIAVGHIQKAFWDVYHDDFNLGNEPEITQEKKPLGSPFEDPLKQLTGQDKTGTEAGTGTGHPAKAKKIKALNSVIPSEAFERFWSAWPSDRRQDKADCATKWEMLGLDSIVDSILADVEERKRSKRWKEGFVELTATYINNKRWMDGMKVVDAVLPGSIAGKDYGKGSTGDAF